MIRTYPDQVRVLLRFKGKRIFEPGEIIFREELERHFKLPNINGLIWNNQIEVVDTDVAVESDTVSDESSATDVTKTPNKRGRRKL